MRSFVGSKSKGIYVFQFDYKYHFNKDVIHVSLTSLDKNNTFLIN